MDFQYNFGNLTHHPYPPPVSRSVYSSEEEEETALDEQIGLVLFFVATIVSVLLVGVCSLRQYYCNYSDVTDTCFPKIFRRGISPQSRTSSEQYHVDRILAETLQRRLNEEERERERQAKRKERRMWYDYYMKPCTLVVEKSFLFYAQGEDSPNLGQQQSAQERKKEDGNGNVVVESNTQRTTSKDEDDEFADSDDEEIGENAKKRGASQFIICDEDDENTALYLKLPAGGEDDDITTSRCVDGTCALCIDEYEAGDNVVWSDLQCPHAFHKECLMQWLSKGKKRCPICRHWFVPGTKIDDQKVIHGEAWQCALTEMKQHEKEENERQTLWSQKEEAENDLEQGIPETSDQNTATVTISESPNNKSGDVELGSTILRHDSQDLEHLGSNSSLDISELDDIESQRRTIPSVPNKATEECPAVAAHQNLKDGDECYQAKEQSDVFNKSEESISDEHNQI